METINGKATNSSEEFEKLKKEVDETIKDMNASAVLLEGYKKMAENDSVAVKNAMDEAKQAQVDAKKAEGNLSFGFILR